MTENNEQSYYNQPELWNELAEYQKNVREDIIQFIPEDVKSILDVGCGNGHIINMLAAKYECTGVDTSSTALEYVKTRKMNASSDALPFPDHSFDLVMINDVLEHLTEPQLRKTLDELYRVTCKYILVTVPFMENLQSGMTWCSQCGTVYHITQHLRAFDSGKLLELFQGKLRPERLIYSGEEQNLSDLVQYAIRSRLHLHTVWDKALCPVCGEKASEEFFPPEKTCGLYAGIRASENACCLPPMRNECIAIYRKNPPTDVPEDTGVCILVDGRRCQSRLTRVNGVPCLQADVSGDVRLEFTLNGIVYTLPRAKRVENSFVELPGWFNNRLPEYTISAARDLLLCQNLLCRSEQLSRQNENLLNELEKCRSAGQNTAKQTQQCQPGAKAESSWRLHWEKVKQGAVPTLCGKQKDDAKPHFLAICHDQDIDRRILQQLDVLVREGWTGVLIALSLDNEDHLEQKNGYQIHRIGLKHILPDCRCYKLYCYLQYRISRSFSFLPRVMRGLTRLNWILYQVGALLYYRCRSIKNPLPFDWAFLFAGRNYPANLILAEDLPALKAAALLKREWRCSLFFDSHEFYPEQRVFSSTQKKLMHETTKSFISECDGISTVSDGIADLFHRFYGVEKPAVIHNVIECQNIEHGSEFHRLLQLDPGQKVILYQGGIIPERNIDNLIRGFVRLNPPDAHLIFLGPASPVYLKKLKKEAGDLLDRKIHFLKAVPREELLKYTASADFGVIPYKVIDLNTKFCMPNKFFEFIQAGLPILSNELIEVEKIFKQIGGGGMIAKLNSPDQVAKALQKMLARELTEDHHVLCRARTTLCWEYESKFFLELIREITHEPESVYAK